ncbi:MAG: hypothetical protein JRF07_02865, partial [Deltaproteobacteria bacterium]|nr:hypothetical protein [Deltaproteobacteria bacterium]
ADGKRRVEATRVAVHEHQERACGMRVGRGFPVSPRPLTLGERRGRETE